jgi:arsenate reductase-like glutaredoxin family protein
VRTTITLDEDVVSKLKAEMRKRGVSFKEVVNEAIRTGLLLRQKQILQKPFVVNAKPMGMIPGLNYDSTSELLEQIEGPWHR